MMTSPEIRQHFLDFFKSKAHTIVPSAPIVIKDDPTLMFTNAGMNQFKDYFLGNKKPPYLRVADTQKCLRVSGKHNDLEEVGVDTYHHTMFEMLGNWSFGDPAHPEGGYFKKEAIEWSWELLTEVYKIDKDRLYVTVFEGDEKENLQKDEEAIGFWKEWIAQDRIIMGNKKDNFWEMGETGPCGPCTEIHVDCRTEEERKNTNGKSLVNNDHPQVIEIWNNVFIQYNRKKDGSLEELPAKHVDTGMGFERLVRVLQNKQSNYDTDVFTDTIAEVEKLSGKKYSYSDSKQDVAFRVIADHIRAIAFTIADGQLPSNTGAGYVIRRILRRAVRYYYSYLDVKEPLLHKLISLLQKQFENIFPELKKQKDFVRKVVYEEEETFLKTLGSGIKLFNGSITEKLNAFDGIKDLKNFKPFGDIKVSEDLQNIFNNLKKLVKNPNDQNEIQSLFKKINSDIFNEKFGISEKNKSLFRDLKKIDGSTAFKLHDTYGFPFDLTKLMSKEIGAQVDEEGFEKELQKQKNRSRAASAIDTEDWIVLNENGSPEFVGYDSFETESNVLKYRKTKSKGKETYQIILDKTPFYAESGGQVGDKGLLFFNGEEVEVTDTKKENDLIIHFTEKLPEKIEVNVVAKINIGERASTQVHHTATHLMHAALRAVLGKHVAQKGSLVNYEHLRFDFSHFAKVTDEEIAKVEAIVNEKIRQNIPVVIKQMKKDDAIALGAMALFGEKYGDTVRVVIMDLNYSIELCGGTHVGNTGELGFFKIKHESAVGAGIRRIEAVAGKAAEDLINEQFGIINSIKQIIKSPSDIVKSLEKIIDEKNNIQKRLESLEVSKSNEIVELILKDKWYKHKDFNIISYSFKCDSEEIFTRVFNMIRAKVKNSVIILGAKINSYEKLRIFLNSKDNNYTSNANPMQFKDEISSELSNIRLFHGGSVVLDASGTFKSGINKVVSLLTKIIQNNIEAIDKIFPLE